MELSIEGAWFLLIPLFRFFCRCWDVFSRRGAANVVRYARFFDRQGVGLAKKGRFCETNPSW
jgi:hypothetical protein